MRRKDSPKGDTRWWISAISSATSGIRSEEVQPPEQTSWQAGFLGPRVTENIARYISLEQIFSFANNPEQINPSGNTLRATIPEHNYTVGALVDLNLRPRESRWVPYFDAGVGYTWYEPSSIGNIQVPSSGLYLAPTSMGSTRTAAFLYGVGVKFNYTKRVDFRLDVMGRFTHRAYFQRPVGRAGLV